MYFNFIRYEYIKAVKNEDEYMLLIGIIEKNKEDMDPYLLIEKYKEYVVLMDIKKLSKGPTHKKWMLDILIKEKSKDSLFINDNFLLLKINDHKSYFDRYNYYMNILSIKKSSKNIIKNGEFPFIGQFKIVKDNEYNIINNSVDKPYFEKYKLLIYGDHLKVNGVGIIYNIVYFLKSNNIKEEDIHICFSFNTNKIKFYIEIISNNTNVLDELITSFLILSEQNFMEYDIIESDNQKLNILNVMEIYNMIDFKHYTIYSLFN